MVGEVVDACEATNHVSFVFVLYADVYGVPSTRLFKALASNAGLEELLLNSIVIDGQVPPQAHIDGCCQNVDSEYRGMQTQETEELRGHGMEGSRNED